jgi:hypothetical protein
MVRRNSTLACQPSAGMDDLRSPRREILQNASTS